MSIFRQESTVKELLSKADLQVTLEDLFRDINLSSGMVTSIAAPIAEVPTKLCFDVDDYSGEFKLDEDGRVLVQVQIVVTAIEDDFINIPEPATSGEGETTTP